MKSMCELIANVEETEVCEMPDVRIIGKYVRNGGKLKNTAPALWRECINDGILDVLKKLPSVIPNSLIGWTGDYRPDDKTTGYVLGVVAPAGTKVPKGFIYRDLRKSIVVKGIFGKGIIDVCGELPRLECKPFYTDIGAVGWWEMEVYFNDDPNHESYSWVFPVERTE